MSWNYRVVQQVHRHHNGDVELSYGIHEEYHGPHGITAEPVRLVSDSLQGLRWQLQEMLRALDQPSIEYDPATGYVESRRDESGTTAGQG